MSKTILISGYGSIGRKHAHILSRLVNKKKITIIIVTHNMQQAARVSDKTAFLLSGDDRCGILIEYDYTKNIFSNPKMKETEDYITGRFS